MNTKVKVALLGSTGYVGFELIKILSKHSKVEINFLGCDNTEKNNVNDDVIEGTFEENKDENNKKDN